MNLRDRHLADVVVLRTIDEKRTDQLDAMDQLREGINLRAYGQKNPLLEYKSDGFKMFQEMMADMNSVTVQRLFRTQLQGMEQPQLTRNSNVRNIQTSHKDTSGMGFKSSSPAAKNSLQQNRAPIRNKEKFGRNQKILVRDPSGKEIEIKYKKLQNYLNKGYTQV